MSLLSWEAEFYDTSASEFKDRSDIDCCRHSLTKWRGLLPENLKKHGVIVSNGVLAEVPNKPPRLKIDGSSCALCIKRYHPRERCIACPIYKALGFSCDGVWQTFVYAPELHVPKMISFLEKTLVWLEAGKEEAEALSKEEVEASIFEDLYNKTLEEYREEAIARKKAWMTTLLHLKNQCELDIDESEGFLCLDGVDMTLYHYDKEDLLAYVPEKDSWVSDTGKFCVVHVFSSSPCILPEESKVSLADLRAFERISGGSSC